jgi:membrane protein YdbS with pleckstrin-like domain
MAKIFGTALEDVVAKVLKVPPEPEPPLGRSESLQVFNAARGFYRYRVIGWLLTQCATLAGFIAGLVFLGTAVGGAPVLAQNLAKVVEVLGFVVFVLQIPFTFMMIELDFRYRWYMVTDSSLRIREGLLSVREQTMTFANIQNLSIRQNPLQRIFGIEDLRVRTAGGGQSQGKGNHEARESADMHLAFFRGVDNAPEIRDLILNRMRALSGSGLGDPDEPPQPELAAAPVGEGDLLPAARELLEECKKLREVLTPTGTHKM